MKVSEGKMDTNVICFTHKNDAVLLNDQPS